MNFFSFCFAFALVLAITLGIPVSYVPPAQQIDVPCPLCWSAMSTLLDFCRDHDGRSFYGSQDFINACSLIGEDEQKELDKKFGCSADDMIKRSRVRVWNRKLRCLQIYNSLLELYSPFDPCTQIRTLVDKAPMAACQSALIKCVPPPVAGEQDRIPPWALNATLPNESPPLTCPYYVANIISACKDIKSNDFYDRSSLDSYCNRTFSGIYQKMGCEVIRDKMKSNDYMMDLCSSLYAQPINVNATTYCANTLYYSTNSSVPLPAYDTYLERVKLFKEAWMMADTDTITKSNIAYPADEVLSTGAQNTTAATPK